MSKLLHTPTEEYSLTTYIFKAFLKEHKNLLILNHWSIQDRLILWLLDKNGFVVAPEKFNPKFLYQLYQYDIPYFAYKSIEDGFYYIVLKSYSKTYKGIRFKDVL